MSSNPAKCQIIHTSPSVRAHIVTAVLSAQPRTIVNILDFHFIFHFNSSNAMQASSSFCSNLRFSPILNEFSKYDVSHQIDLIRHYHKYYVEHLLHGKYQFRLNVCLYDFIFQVLHKFGYFIFSSNQNSAI